MKQATHQHGKKRRTKLPTYDPVAWYKILGANTQNARCGIIHQGHEPLACPTDLMIPNRSFQFADLFGNILGVIISILIVRIYNYLEKR